MSSSADSSVDIASNLTYVNDRITKCVQDCNRPEGSVKLVAVSKTKPVELLMDAYNVSSHNTLYFDEKILRPQLLYIFCFVVIIIIGWSTSFW